MKSIFLKLTLPATFATLLASADQLSYTKNLPLDSKLPSFTDTAVPAYENKISIGIGGLSYQRIKPNAPYVGIWTSIYHKNAFVTALGGYNFLLSEKDILTPAFGFGYYFGNHNAIPVVGVGYDHTFNDVISLGAEVSSTVGRNLVYTVGIPLTIHFGEQKKWEFRVMPAYLRYGSGLLSNNNSLVLGLSFGYRF
jgi:hypothetical protein